MDHTAVCLHTEAAPAYHKENTLRTTCLHIPILDLSEAPISIQHCEMAPSIAYPGLYAEVTVDGCRLTEYDDGEDACSKTRTVYIQSEAGEQFGVQYFIPPSLFMEYGIKAEVSIDGVSMRKYIHDNYVGRLHGVSRYACASSAHIGNLFIGQRFRFATLDTRKLDPSISSDWPNKVPHRRRDGDSKHSGTKPASSHRRHIGVLLSYHQHPCLKCRQEGSNYTRV